LWESGEAQRRDELSVVEMREVVFCGRLLLKGKGVLRGQQFPKFESRDLLLGDYFR
jgi:hypothetical protein